jgi:hypothetical protein
MANIPAEQLQRVNQNHFRHREKRQRVEGQHLQHLLWSVNEGNNFPSFRMLSAIRYAYSSAKFICASTSYYTELDIILLLH